MGNDDYWEEVQKAYEDCLREGYDMSENEIWDYAKERVERHRFLQFIEEKARKEGRNFLELLKQADREARKQQLN